MLLKSCCCGVCSLKCGTEFASKIGLVLGAVGTLASMPMLKTTQDGPPIYVGILAMMGSVETLLTNALTLYGVWRRKSVYLVPWLLLQTIMLLVAFVAYLAYFGWAGSKIVSTEADDQKFLPMDILAGLAVALALLIALVAYVDLVVLSYYKVLRNEEKMSLTSTAHRSSQNPPPLGRTLELDPDGVEIIINEDFDPPPPYVEKQET